MTDNEKAITLTDEMVAEGFAVTVERLGAVKARQVIWTTRDAEATVGLSDDDLVTVVKRCTPFGTFTLSVAPGDYRVKS